MFLRTEILPSKKLIGKHLCMSIAGNKTMELWRGFMPRRNEIKNTVGTDLFSMQIFNSNFNFQQFDIHAEFEKWAALEVSNYDEIPEGMQTHDLEGGLYAVFLHKGPASQGRQTFQYIFAEWIPQSEYEIDNREHFEIIGEKYKNEDPNSEEEIWIPIRKK
jgi:AraC family transcriptional regulator